MRRQLPLTIALPLALALAAACTAEETDQVESTNSSQDPIILGAISPQDDRMVAVSSPGGFCSAQLLRNDVVLTSRHCVTTNATVGGPLAAPGDVEIASSVLVSAGLEIADIDTSTDIALVRTVSQFEVNGDFQGYSTIMYPLDDQFLLNQLHQCKGFGAFQCDNSGAGTLRFHWMPPTSISGDWLVYPPSGSVSPWNSDSGATCWYPWFDEQTATGVHQGTVGSCPATAYNVKPTVFRQWARDQMETWRGADFVDDFSNTATFSDYTVYDPAGAVLGPSQWTAHAAGYITENSNIYTSPTTSPPRWGTKLIHNRVVRDVTEISISIFSTDDDAAGIIAGFRDETHYYRFAVDEERDYAEIVRRDGSSYTTLASVPFSNFDWSTNPTLKLVVAELGNPYYAISLSGYVDGVWIVWGIDWDMRYPVGKVGLYDWGMATTTLFDNFLVTNGLP